MAGRIKGCFDTASKLTGHNPDVLCRFLEHFPVVLKKFKIVLPSPVDRKGMPYDTLRAALMFPDIGAVRAFFSGPILAACFAFSKSVSKAALSCRSLKKFPEYLKECGLELPANSTQDNLGTSANQAA